MNEEFVRPDFQGIIKTSEKFYKQLKCATHPPLDIEKAVSDMGVTILRSKLEGDVSGYLFVSKGSAPIIGVNSKHPLTRQRFTIAHELGHLLLHVRATENVSFVDKSFLIMNRDASSGTGIEVKEVEANFFAADILMPAEALYRDLVQVQHPVQIEKVYDELAKKYGVSKEAMSFRLNNLGFIRL